MGFIDAFVDIAIGITMLLVLGEFITSLWPALVLVYGNSEIFALGSVILGFVGLTALAYSIAVLVRGFKEIAAGKEKIRGFLRGDETQ